MEITEHAYETAIVDALRAGRLSGLGEALLICETSTQPRGDLLVLIAKVEARRE